MKTILLAILAVLVASCVSGEISYQDPESGVVATVHLTPRPEK